MKGSIQVPMNSSSLKDAHITQRQDAIWQSMIKIIRKKKSLSKLSPTFKNALRYLSNLLFSFITFRILNNLVSFTNLYNLPILAILAKPLMLDYKLNMTSSNGMIAKMSNKNHPLM